MEQPASALTWYRPKVKAADDNDRNLPEPRSCHSLTVVGTNAFLFGGMADLGNDEAEESYDFAKASNDLFKLDISGKSLMEWTRIPEAQEMPLPRWKHTATLYDNTQILVFGGFHSTDHRLNDVWVFDVVGYTWSQPNVKHNNEAMVPCQLINTEWPNVPPPRAAHSTTLIGDTVYVFGGYGGLGYGRRDLDDLYSLDIYSWTWAKLAPKGTAPEKRSGHQACAIERKMYVFGGSSSSTQFDDVYVLDTEQDPPVWSKLESSLPLPTWNLSACSVIAIPSWKIFTFGGVSGVLSDNDRQGKMINSTAILDTGIERWQLPKVEGKAPSARSDTCLAYDPKGSRLLVFGGWADEWHSDLYTLDVGNVVGPPYAITDLSPNNGPVTGGSDITIYGIDFINTKNIVVRFGSSRSSIDVPGMFVSQTKISCVSPNATKFPPGEVDVRISLEGDSFTTTFQKYSYFSVTNSSSCIMYGPGLLSGCATAEEVCFVIQARDDNNQNRSTGGDEFSVVITMKEDGEDAEPIRLSGVLVDDLDNGKYLVTYVAKYPGKYTVDVDFMGTFGGKAGPLRGSGVVVAFSATAPRENNQMSGDLVLTSLKQDINHLQKFTEDLSRNVLVRVRDDSWSADEQIQVLMRIKESLMLIESKQEETSLVMDRSEAILSYLAGDNVVTNGQDEVLSASKFLWEKILREAPQIQNKIAPMMRAHSSKIKTDIQSYEAHIKAYKQALAKAEYYLYATGTKRSLDLVEAAEAIHKQEQVSCDKMTHIANIFECVKEMDLSRALMSEISTILEDFKVLWEVNLKVVTAVEEANKIAWSVLDPESLEDSAKSLVQNLRRLPKTVRQSDAFQGMDKAVKEFVVTCPIISSLRSPAMRERHWRELMDVVKQEFELPSARPQMPLKHLLNLNLHKHATEVDEITEKALKEAKHEDTLASLESTWSGVNYTMSYYKDTDVPLLKLEDDIVEQLESDQMAVQSIVGSRYGHFKTEATEWQRTLGLVSDVSQLLLEIQRTWSYLEPLFIGSEEVRKELPEDAKRFQDIDVQVKSILQKGWKIRNVKNMCVQPGLLDKLHKLEISQDQCKKSLSEFLDGKRRQFPRFYFTSEADLLDILSNSSQPAKVLAQVDKILLATKELVTEQKAGADRPSATHFIAGVGKETVRFTPAVKLIGKAEQYLRSLLDAQVLTLSQCLAQSMARYPQSVRTEWVTKKDVKTGECLDPAQIILLVAAIDFVQQVEKSMAQVSAGEGRSMTKCFELVKQQLADLISLTQASALSKADRQRVMCMITTDAHNRDILDILLKEKALAVTDFQWQSKLRPSYISDPKSTEVVSNANFSILTATFEYGFEYLGNGPRLVITPLTDRIYVTATQALHLKMGCAPAGPAGTGKTESTKDLAAALGKCCYVFNCSPEMDYQSMGNIFKGLAASGSWGCFDEFNRLIPEVLSVCSVQFKAVCDSLRLYDREDETTHKVTIESDTVSLDPTCGAFITMNPGYLGRSELPEGLKALFRPITVMVPDLVLICENMMMAEGFLNAKLLASKFYGLYSLLAELLSKQSHYDWGLRAVKSVLVVAGQLRRAEPELNEEALLMRALRDFNIPKIVQADEVVFFGLLNDLFPDLNPPRVFDEELSECISAACDNHGLWPDPFFTLKVMQLDELLDIRHCVFVMGPAGASKSTCWKMLQAARNLRYPDNKVKITDLNPKTMLTEDLYGHISMATREWKDGLLSSLMRDLGRIPDEKPKWIVLDGDLDANWIESMNSVMDDNKMLTLASNERIPLKHYMRMIFEIRDLKFATPATVSRAGILYISTDGGSQWRSIIGSWVRSRPDELLEDSDRELIHSMFEKYMPTCLRYFSMELQSVVQCNDISISISVLRLLDSVLTRSVVVDATMFEIAFVFCLIWGFGCVLTIADDGTDNRKLFSEWFRGKFKTVKIPSRDTIFDYWLDPRTSKFESWKASPAFREVEFDSNVMNMAEVTVPTAETASVSYWLDLLVRGGFHVMLAGPAGTGKTQLVNGLLSSLQPEQHIHTSVNMNFYTSASVLLTSLEPQLQKRTGTTFGPPGAAKMVYFVDDLNLPEVDAYGTQSAIALLRQHIDYGHWYDINKLTLKTVDDCQYISALNPTAGSFNVNTRLQRHFTCFSVAMPSATSLLTIYQTFLDGHLFSQGFNNSVQSVSSTLIKGALAVHKEVSEAFRKTAANFHY